jgi:hypothetical protein
MTADDDRSLAFDLRFFRLPGTYIVSNTMTLPAGYLKEYRRDPFNKG